MTEHDDPGFEGTPGEAESAAPERSPVAGASTTSPWWEDPRVLAGAVAAWAVAVYVMTNRDVPAAIFDAIGLNRDRPEWWQLGQAVFWSSLAAAAYAVWRRLPDRPPLRRPVVYLAAFAGAFQVAALVLLGLLSSFGSSPYSHRFLPLVANVVYVSALLVAFELSRAVVVKVMTAWDTTAALAVSAVFFAALTIALARYTNFPGGRDAVRFVGSDILPALAESLLASFLVLLSGPIASLAYRGVLMAFEWLSPVLPNLSWSAAAFAGTLAPLIGFWIVLEGEETDDGAGAEDGEAGSAPVEDEDHRASSWLRWSTGFLVVLVILVFLVGGLLGVRPIAVSGQSMYPTFSQGDLVLLRDVEPEDIRIGDVIRFSEGGIPVIHRVVAIEQDAAGRYIFTTRGDNNNVDDPPVRETLIDGKVIMHVPKLGWPSLWFRDIFG